MSSTENRKRGKWQDYSGENAEKAEQLFFSAFSEYFKGKDYEIIEKPSDFKNLYVNVALTEDELSEIYKPKIPVTKHGVFPDYAIINNKTRKKIYVEVKRQDGWVEGGKRSDGRGNAHERSSKFFTPGLLEALRKEGNIDSDKLPFWTVFQGDITKDPCRVREITFWYGDENRGHYFFWRDTSDSLKLTSHFENYIKQILD